ncbi:MAG TPA: glycosyl hydrolase 115 family protein, partial [Tepidisphaeraceae bacterium]|nr:glycosyl hydrolase 115 family protein [Tepidisphaeraceae bacterium]
MTILTALLAVHASAAPDLEIMNVPAAADAGIIAIASDEHVASIIIDPQDFPVVHLAAGFFADDVERMSGHRPLVGEAPVGDNPVIIVGTIGHSAIIDRLARQGKLPELDKIKGHWETTLWAVVENPMPNVARALVIGGSDRRGTAYGLMQLSERIGVSPWYWWADVPAQHRDSLAVRIASPQVDSPGVKYRGIFINDEDWGLNPWAKPTFDPEFKNIGPKTYEKVFELMLRLRLNYIWPAMHACSTEFGSMPENVALADKYGIVAGASHCEPMLCNNVKWDVNAKGPWDYSKNRDVIRSYWEDMVKARGDDEAVWTLGIRGIHDAPMNGPKDIPARVKLVTEVIHDQRELIDNYVSP